MASNQEYYDQWKGTATHSQQFQQTQKQTEGFEANREKFFACTN